MTDLANLKLANFQNPFIAYLNINSLRHKIIDLRHILSSAGLELVAISETKLSSEFPDVQFQIDGYQFPPLRKDRDKHGGGLMVFVKNDIIAKCLTELEPKYIECICAELNISKENWIIFVVYRPPEYSLSEFFEKLSEVVDLAITKYENVVILGDINVDTQDSNSLGFNKVQDLCDISGLRNLIRTTTCKTKTSSSSIDIILTTRTQSFKNSGTIETGLSDFHKLVMTSFRSTYERLRPTKITYRSYKKFKITSKSFAQELLHS